jgi:GNAT superfamily N-acetyltransferase
VTAFEATHLGGVLALCTAEGWPTFPSDPHRALRALLAAGATTVVALDADGEVIGFAHALSDGVTIYLAELLVAPAHRHRGIGRRLVSELSTGATLCAWISSPTAPKPSTRACRIGAMPVSVFTGSLAGQPRADNGDTEHVQQILVFVPLTGPLTRD